MLFFHRFFFVVVVLFRTGGLVTAVPGDTFGILGTLELFLSFSGTQTASVLLEHSF